MLGYSEPKSWNADRSADLDERQILSLIEREAENAKKATSGVDPCKDEFCDPKIIAGLYCASSCGVQELLVRGIAV